MRHAYDKNTWTAMTAECGDDDDDPRFRASVAHWNGADWREIWIHSDVFTSRTRARNVAIKKINELSASGYQRPVAA